MHDWSSLCRHVQWSAERRRSQTERSHPVMVFLVGSFNQTRRRSLAWLTHRKSYASKATIFIGVVAGLIQSSAIAQSTASPAPAGLSFSDAKSAIEPLTHVFAGIVYGLSAAWHYLMLHPPAAVILSAIAAAIAAFLSIHHQREIARLRETFTTINNDNWDKDVIEARRVLAKIRSELKESPHDIAKFCHLTDENISERTTLQTIMNDYENLALGVRMNILDEKFLYRWMRGVLIQDWKTLSPLIGAYRSHFGNPQIYIEFDGLVNSWQVSRSYRTGRKIRPAKKRTKIY